MPAGHNTETCRPCFGGERCPPTTSASSPIHPSLLLPLHYYRSTTLPAACWHNHAKSLALIHPSTVLSRPFVLFNHSLLLYYVFPQTTTQRIEECILHFSKYYHIACRFISNLTACIKIKNYIYYSILLLVNERNAPYVTEAVYFLPPCTYIYYCIVVYGRTYRSRA